jgi:CheY-like chemotaxis protein
VNEILFVDDEPRAMRLYFEVLKAAGFTVTPCSRADDALEILRKDHLKLSAVILDIMMPPGESYGGLDTHEGLTTGVHLFRDLRTISATLPVIILTNVSNPETLRLIQPDEHLRVVAKMTCSPHELIENVLTPLGVVGGRPKHEFTHLVDDLGHIPEGSEYASAYHKLVFRILIVVFDGQLSSGTIEREIHDGRKRVDIVFRNSAERGFFADLFTRFHIKCPYVFIECKNYSADVANPEFDQLTGRLSDKRGLFGILVSRKIRNKRLMSQRSRDVVSDNRGYVLVLDDDDLTQLLDMFASERIQGVSQLMHERLGSILLTSSG